MPRTMRTGNTAQGVYKPKTMLCKEVHVRNRPLLHVPVGEQLGLNQVRIGNELLVAPEFGTCGLGAQASELVVHLASGTLGGINKCMVELAEIRLDFMQHAVQVVKAAQENLLQACGKNARRQ